MQKLLVACSCLFLLACGSNNSATSSEVSSVDSSIQLLQTSKQILASIKNDRMEELSTYFHPEKGVVFSPYAYVESNEGALSADAFLHAYNDGDSLLWGSYDGSGHDIKLTVKEYFESFVYKYDFLNAEQHSVDSFIGSGNSLNNLKESFPGKHFTEHYFSGFDPQYGGMDWGCVRLVYEAYQNRLFLIAVINDQWTI